MLKDNELLLEVTTTARAHDFVRLFVEDFYIDQQISRGVNDNGLMQIAYQHAPHIESSCITDYPAYYMALKYSLNELFTCFGYDTALINDLLILSSSYQYIKEKHYRENSPERTIYNNAKLLTRLLLVPFPAVTKENIFKTADGAQREEMDEYILQSVQQITERPIDDFKSEGALNVNLIDEKTFERLGMFLNSFYISIEKPKGKKRGTHTWQFSSSITMNFLDNKTTLPITKSQQNNFTRSIILDLILEQQTNNTVLFDVITEPDFNQDRKSKLSAYVRGRKEFSHNMILTETSKQILSYLDVHAPINLARRKGSFSKDLKVFLYYFYALQSLLLVDTKPYMRSTPEHLYQIVREFKQLTMITKNAIASKFNEIVKGHVSSSLKPKR